MTPQFCKRLKRKAFEHEKEVRAFKRILGGSTRGDSVNSEEPPEGSSKIDVDIDKVVETIRVQPATPTWVKGVIEKLLRRYSWNMKVMSSQIDSEPRY